MALITGSWSNTTLVCANHPNLEEAPAMDISASSRTLAYVCPKCDALNCAEDEDICKNRLPIYEYEKMLDQIASVIADAEENDEITNLRGYHWRRKSYMFKVLKHEDGHMVVSVLDKTILEN